MPRDQERIRNKKELAFIGGKRYDFIVVISVLEVSDLFS